MKKNHEVLCPKSTTPTVNAPDMIIYSLSKLYNLNFMKLKRTGICWANFKHDRLLIQMESISTIFILLFYPTFHP